MAVDMFIKVGDIEGESRDDKHPDEFDVLSWSWGMSQSGTFRQGGGGGAGKVSIQNLSFTKYIDKGTNELMLLCSNGGHIPEAKLTVRKAGTDPLEYLIITMQKVMVTSVSTGGSAGEDQLTENITLDFTTVQVEYTPQMDDGSGGAMVSYAWNVEKNMKM